MTVYELPATQLNNDVGALTHEVGLGQIPYGLHVPYNQGYDAQSRQKTPRAEDTGSSGNFFSHSLGAQIELWITRLSAEFSLSGEQGQSRMLREFFPRSFNDVVLTITGNTASTQEYNRLAGFVRQSHWRALQAINQGASADQTITFKLYDYYGDRSWPPPQTRTSDVALVGESGSPGLATVKGPHRPWEVQGYVKSIAAGAKREVAPEFTIQFIVTSSKNDAGTGIWGDDAYTGNVKLKSMLEILHISGSRKRLPGPEYVTDPVSVPAAPAARAVSTVPSNVWSGAAAKQILTGT